MVVILVHLGNILHTLSLCLYPGNGPSRTLSERQNHFPFKEPLRNSYFQIGVNNGQWTSDRALHKLIISLIRMHMRSTKHTLEHSNILSILSFQVSIKEMAHRRPLQEWQYNQPSKEPFRNAFSMQVYLMDNVHHSKLCTKLMIPMTRTHISNTKYKDSQIALPTSLYISIQEMVEPLKRVEILNIQITFEEPSWNGILINGTNI